MMRLSIAIGICFVCFLTGCATVTPQLSRYEDASPEEKKTFVKAHVPFPTRTKFTVLQGAFRAGGGNEFSWNFEVPFGTAVTSVQDGVVLDVFEPNIGGSCAEKYSDFAHDLLIRHRDGSVARYSHIQSLVRIGEKVKAGQKIAVTAENGMICHPQLRFGIYKSEQHLSHSVQAETVPVYFLEIPDGLAREGEVIEVR